ncbi:glycosyltransferase family 2 protein [Mycoplasmopsis primatum]|uniref:glycosyltransferase family 2 protein n=1 Tax=Mycoplasmopsis primatum TaxID=55604 RepID=UPI00069232EF|nr:glycosyltransferase family 2 protein [Mycoplasmopsis primatum]
MTKKQPKISVLIPCHNIEKLSYFSLKSVLKNKYPNMEILLLNDYSTDNTLDILRQYANKDPRIKVFDLKDYHEHVGLGFNRDFLIEKATGEYFLFIDDDDKMHYSTIQILADNLDNDYDIVACNYWINYELFKNFRILSPDIPKFHSFDINNAKEFYLNGTTFSWAKLIKKEFYKKIVNKYGIKFDGSSYEDIRFIYALFLTNPKFKYINKKLYTYQLRQNSLSTNLQDINLLDNKISSIFTAYESAISNIIKFGFLNDDEIEKLKELFTIHLMIIFFWLSKLFLNNNRRLFISKVRTNIKNFFINFNIKLNQKPNINNYTMYVYKKAINIFYKYKEKNESKATKN